MGYYWSGDYKGASVEDLQGAVIVKAEIIDHNEEIHFTTEDGRLFIMYHEQDCCESVYVEDIDGDLEDIVGGLVLDASERTNYGDNDWGSETWTFYHIATTKGTIVIRWYGSSNGYYSESVNMVVKRLA